MCTGQSGANQMLKTASVKPPIRKDLTNIRKPLAVVAAAVLLQLTIAARHTLSVGFNDDTWRDAATMEKKAAFAVFLVAETVAFCCAFSALFCIVWSASFGADQSMTLLHQSVPLLITTALMGTLVVFVTGVSLISPVSLWTTFGICIVCPLVGFWLF